MLGGGAAVALGVRVWGLICTPLISEDGGDINSCSGDDDDDYADEGAPD